MALGFIQRNLEEISQIGMSGLESCVVFVLIGSLC